MASGDLVDNPPRADLSGEFPAGPLADRPLAVGRGRTGKGDDGGDLGSSNAYRLAGTRHIGEAVADRQVVQRDGLEGQPAGAPAADHVDADVEGPRDLAIIVARRGS